MKLVSIIIPHYNNWEMLDRLLQTIPDKNEIEVIVIDDKSINSEYYISLVQMKFPKIIIKENKTLKKGAGVARNIGLELATGKWLLFADSDDFFTEIFYEVISSYFDTNLDLIYFSPKSIFEYSDKESSRHISYENYIEEYLTNKSRKSELRLRYKFEPPWSKLIRHNVVKQNKIRFEERMVANDILFSAKIGYYCKKISASNDPIYIIREREGSLTNKTDESKFKERFSAWVNYIIFLRNNLSKDSFENLNVSSIPQVLSVVKNKLGVENIIYVINNCYKNDIPLFDKRLINPIFVYEQIGRFLN